MSAKKNCVPEKVPLRKNCGVKKVKSKFI